MNDEAHPFIIRAGRGRAYADAQSILTEAKAEAARIRAEAVEERSAALTEARTEGLRQAAAEAVAFAAATARAFDTFWAERESELRDLTFAVAHRVLSQLPSDELVQRLISEAIADYGHNVELTLRLSPKMAEGMRRALDGDPSRRIKILSDPALSDEECTLVHPQGQTNIGLIAQFRGMLSSRDKISP